MPDHSRGLGRLPLRSIACYRRLTLSLVLLFLLITPLNWSQENGGSSSTEAGQEQVAPATPITLPALGDPFLGPPELAGLSGFFLTRSAMESATLALETVPIQAQEISKLKTLGQDTAKEVDDLNLKLKIMTGIAIGVPIVLIVGDLVYDAITRHPIP